MEAIIIKSEKGKDLLVIDGFKFSFHKLLARDTLKRWLCASRKTQCKAFVKTKLDRPEVIESSLNHNHEKLSEELLNRQTLSNAVKIKAIEDVSAKPMGLIRKEVRESHCETITTHDVERMRKNMYTARSKIASKLPTNIVEFHSLLNSVTLKTNRDEYFILKNDEINNIVMFSCKTNLFALKEISELYVDGTFDYCPKFFLQLFTIHGFKNNHYIPLVFFLLKNKNTLSYKLALQYLKEIYLSTTGHDFLPKTITSDFELAIHKAIREIFPKTQIKGCLFHLGQSWYRKIQTLGLSTEYQLKDNLETDITKYLTYIFGLPFLKAEDVGDCFVLDLVAIQPDDERVIKFNDYLVETYIDEISTFPPNIWAENSSSLKRTTNACESFHSRYNASFYNTHPNFNQFIKVLLDFQIDTYIKLQSIDTVVKVYDRKVLMKKKFLDDNLKKLEDGSITNFQFLKNISFKCRI